MKAFEFDSLLLRNSEYDTWLQQSLESISTAYVDEDAIYESLIDEPQTR
jgi:hypothetical protein